MRNLQVRTYTDLVTEPVSVAEARDWCKVTGTQHDTVLGILITSARQALEKYTNSSFAAKTLHATWIRPPDDLEFELPYGPHIAVSAVYRIDSEGTETALTVNADYWVYGDQDFVLKINRYWSTSGVYGENSYRVEYTAGYGHTNTETLPARIKEAIMKEVATNFDIRESINIGNLTTELSNSARKMVDPYRRKIWF